MSELEEALNFIKKIERENPEKSAYEIANNLRGYTKKEYTTQLWSVATGYHQDYIEGEFKEILNREKILLNDKPTDFGHFIAALSDQINQPGVNWSDLTTWTGDHTSWAGDIASAITYYYSKASNGQVKTIEKFLNTLASDADYRSDIAAYVVGEIINSGKRGSVSDAIYYYNNTSYSENVRFFIKERLKGNIQGNQLINSGNVDVEIRRSLSTFIRLHSTSEVFKSVKNWVKLKPQLEWENPLLPSGVDLLRGSRHFLSHLVREGGLDNLKFKPYQMPEMPWLGTVNYNIIIP